MIDLEIFLSREWYIILLKKYGHGDLETMVTKTKTTFRDIETWGTIKTKIYFFQWRCEAILEVIFKGNLSYVRDIRVYKTMLEIKEKEKKRHDDNIGYAG